MAKRLKATFPNASDIEPSRLRILDQLASSFDSLRPDEEGAFVALYEAAFSQDRLHQLSADEFKFFYHSPRVASVGSGARAPDQFFKTRAGEDYMLDVRSAIQYLLWSSEGTLESRLTDLIYDRGGVGVPGIKETVLTKVLAVAMPDRVFPLVTYDSDAGGKLQIADKVFGLVLPPADRTSIGRLIIRSSDLFAEIGRRWWDDLRVAGAFVWNLWKGEELQGEVK